ncbi:GpE family phage tail protein [Escherichia coli]|nr:GpE family phage tail protein [Escherichia coli]EFM7609148.1 GpE family phage tail protein [Escherichia coli]EFM7684140.1 GpE family phage tail protein [Escherichia coli]
MADVAVIFHWPPSELYPMSLTELITWREKALRRSGNTNEQQCKITGIAQGC